MRTVVFYLDRRKEAEKTALFVGGEAVRYSKDAFERAFRDGDRIVAIVAAGIVVRALAPLIKDKWTDPSVVLLSPDLSFAVPLLGGHHGANELARQLETLGSKAVITTATESRGLEAVEVVARQKDLDIVNKDSTRRVNASILEGEVPIHLLNGPAMVIVGPGVSVLSRRGDYVVGLGCNRGTSAEEVEQAVHNALGLVGIGPGEVLAYATTRKKLDEPGLRNAVSRLGSVLMYLDDDLLNAQDVEQSKAALIGLKGVAEPSALSLSTKKELVLERRAYGNVTVAIAR